MSEKLKDRLTGQTQLAPYERFRGQVNLLRPDIGKLVGVENVDKFVRVCQNAVQANPDVLNADRRSLLLACMEAAQDNLMPDGRDAVFNIYKTKVKDGNTERWVQSVQYIPMVYGLVQKIYEAGATYVDAVAVYEKDQFDYERGDEPKISHKPYSGDDSPGKVIAAYCIVKIKGDVKREVMWRRDIETVKAKSKQPEGMMWKDFYDQGAIKSVIHRIEKQLPRSAKLGLALAHDNAAVGLADASSTVDDGSGADLADIIDGKVKTEPNATPPAPKKGDPGTPELKKKYLDLFETTLDATVLDIKMDEARFLKWETADLKELEDVYRSKREDLGRQPR